MSESRRWIRPLIKGFLRLVFRAYYRSVQIQGLDRFPLKGPALLVANHPNSLVDPAILIHLLPRRVRFGARHGLFLGPLRPILESLGAIPLYRQKDSLRAQRQNLVAIEDYAAHLCRDRVAAIFPEGYSQDDPQVVTIKSGVARIALRAEAQSSFKLGLHIVPVGLQFEPKRGFRADAFVRLGEPFRFDDLASLHKEAPRHAVRELTGRIETALKKLAFHIDSTEHVPLVERLVDLYLPRVRATGLSGVSRKGIRGELMYRMAACLNHFLEVEPTAVAEIESALKRYDDLRWNAGVNRSLLERPPRLLPGPLMIGQALTEAFLGAPIALVGLLASGVPYFVTKLVASQIASRSKHPPSLSIAHILVGTVAFPLAFGLQIAWVWKHFSDTATLAFALLLVPTGLFALAYARRMRKLAAHLGGVISSWMDLEAVARAARARDELIARLDQMRDRYRVEVLGWEPLPADQGIKWLRMLPWAVVAASLLLGLFVLELRDRQPEGLQHAPSPWHQLRETDPEVLDARLLRDARSIGAAITELNRMEVRMHKLRGDFLQDRRSYYTQADHEAINHLLLTYLNLRTALLRTIWIYRGSHDEPGEGSREAQAFLLAYSSAAILFDKASVIVETFREDKWAQKKLNQGDLAWELPEGTYDRLLASLSNEDVLIELSIANDRFDYLREGGEYSNAPWTVLAEASFRARSSIKRAAEGIDERKLALALRKMNRHLQNPLNHAQALVSTWIGDFRLKERPRFQGLISSSQVEELKMILEPGDILLERRNWFLSNAFLPGFWPHAAIYLGKSEQLEQLGVHSDPRSAPHWSRFLGHDAAGHSFAVIEAISDGVVFTSLEHSAGEADAIAVLRPRLSEADRGEAIIRAFSHIGKPYDFQFDFFSTHQLVCSEVVYRAYAGMLDLPLTSIMGRQTLPVNTFVEVFAKDQGSSDCPFELVLFLDMDEKGGCAVASSESAFLETLQRSRFTFLQ